MMKVASAFALLMVTPAAAQEQSLAVGQVWTVKAPAAVTLRIRIGKIETLGGTRVVSVSLSGAPCPPNLGCRTTGVAHAPFDEGVLKASLGTMVVERSREPAEFKSGYREWKNAKGGFFTIAPQAVTDAIFSTVLASNPAAQFPDDGAPSY